MASPTDLLRQLLEINVFQVGEFVLKSGVTSPIYIDLRRIVAHPKIIKSISEEIYNLQKRLDIPANVICGVPYTALPVASVLSVLYDIPMVMKRKEAKGYGTKKMVEGITQKGVSCLIIEDIVTSGSSVIETAEVLRKEGLIVTHCVVVLNRMQGGQENLSKAGIKLHSLFTISDIFKLYCSLNNVEQTLVKRIAQYLQDNTYIPIEPQTVMQLTFRDRAIGCKQQVTKRLFEIIADKESNLAVAVDALQSEELLRITDEVGPHICILKTHIDILNDFTDEVALQLSSLAKKHNFLIFEDRKFADIGNTVMHQYKNGIYRIQQWADIVTVHGLPGSGILDALKTASMGQDRACVLIAEMSSKGTLTDSNYMKKIVEMAEDHLDYVIGFITQESIAKNPNLVHMTPGVNIAISGDSLGQQYKSPEEAIANGADILIVGRGICGSTNIAETAAEYKNRGYKAYLKKCTV